MRSRLLILDSLMLGVVGALSARAFMFSLGDFRRIVLVHFTGYHAPGLPREGHVLKQIIGIHGIWLIPIVTTVGGLFSGVLVYATLPLPAKVLEGKIEAECKEGIMEIHLPKAAESKPKEIKIE